jgi:pyruvyltransferase
VVKVYYWDKRPNFGDQLTGLILTKFIRLPSEWAPPEEAELVMVGSILGHLDPDFSGVIAGAGKLHEKTELYFPDAKILAVRGPLTARGLKGKFVLADPALLADELVPMEDKRYELGIVPHWTDKNLEYDPTFQRFNPLIIRVGDDPLEVIAKIGRCKKIVSSSLHGIIVADAFNIPRRIELPPRALSHAHQEGGLFKWEDYSASLRVKLEIGVTREIDRNKVLEKQYQLYDVLKEIKSIFTKRG